jgi:hypothetical protein
MPIVESRKFLDTRFLTEIKQLSIITQFFLGILFSEKKKNWIWMKNWTQLSRSIDINNFKQMNIRKVPGNGKLLFLIY